jgi:hypothetical protein
MVRIADASWLETATDAALVSSEVWPLPDVRSTP